MILGFVNEDVPQLRFEVTWDDSKTTPPFKLEVGSSGAVDLDLYGIPAGAECHIKAWQEGTQRVYIPQQEIVYKKCYGIVGTIKFVKSRFVLGGNVLTHQAA